MNLFSAGLPDNTAICPQCGSKYDLHGWHTCGSIADAIAARDKWWVEKIQKIIDLTAKSVDQEPCIYCNMISKEWEQLKREIGL